jgi:hypothetical protein
MLANSNPGHELSLDLKLTRFDFNLRFAFSHTILIFNNLL